MKWVNERGYLEQVDVATRMLVWLEGSQLVTVQGQNVINIRIP